MITLTSIQRKVLAEISLDSRAPVSTVARRLGLREHVVRNTIRFLSDKLSLEPYCFTDPYRQSLLSFRIYFCLRSGDTGRVKKMLSYLSALSETTWLFSLYGYYHFGWSVRARSVSMLDTLLAELDQTFGSIVQKRSIGIIARYVHFVPWLAHSGKGARRGFEFTLGDFPTRIDDVDRSLISEIRKAPSASVAEWSRKLGLPSSTVSYRFEKLLENKVLIAFFHNYETRAVGTECFLILVALYGFGGTAHDHIIEFARNHPRATWAAKIIGEWQVEIEVALDDPHELHRIIEQIHQVGQGQVREVITHAWGQDL